MANVAQTINCLHSLFAAVGDRYVRTPVYSVFEMYRPHMGGRRVPARIEVPELAVPLLEGTGSLPGLSGSASVRDQTVTLTLTNPSLKEEVVARVALQGGARPREARAVVLTHDDMRAANTFSEPNAVVPATLAASLSGDAVTVGIPRQSVAAVSILLG
jgi:alpha-N-arabinofuranosidase